MVNNTFETLYSRLNKEQKRAVDTTEGPVMVTAGPGTGKTSILTLRIANILKKTDTSPENILALTFTESGAYNMRRKLVEIVGSEAYKVNINTFHGFCNGIIQDYPERFPRIIGATNISEIDQIKIMEEIIDGKKLEYLKSWSNPFYYVKPILSEIRNLKREAVSAEDFGKLLKKQEKNLLSRDDLYHTKGAYKGKMKGEFVKEKEYIEKNKELHGLYEDYEASLLKNKVFDYEDMIVEVVKVLKKDSDFLLILQENFQYILADEHQDANNAQNAILELLSNFHSTPNLFIVGDEKQAIFRFQGASIENFLYFKNLYPDALLINLESNYRSTQNILDASHSLIEKNKLGGDMKRVRLLSSVKPEEKTEKKAEKTGKAENAEKDSKFDSEFIDVYEFSNEEKEYDYIASNIKEKINSGAKADEIAVLYRNNKDAFKIADFLSKNGVKFKIESDKDLLKDDDIRKIRLVLNVLNNLTDDHSLGEMLFISFLNFKALDIYKVINHSASSRKKIYDTLNSKELLESAGVSEPLKFLELSKNLNKWALLAKEKQFIEFFEIVVKEIGFLEDIVSSKNSLNRMNSLEMFFNEIKNISNSKREYYLADFIEYLELLENHGLLVKANNSSIVIDGVRLMTAHRSKGLEFKFVYIINAVHSKWGGKKDNKKFHLPNIYGKNLEDTKVDEKVDKEGDKEAEKGENKEGDKIGDKIEDERRLFYVALTRAKEKVVISYSKVNDEGKEALGSEFIEEIDESLVRKIGGEEISKIEKSLEKGLIEKHAPKAKHEISLTDKEYIRELFKEQGLSVTALNNYLECPWKYFFINLIRLPQTQNKYLMYGNAIHETLRVFFNKYREEENLTKDEFLNLFEFNLNKQNLYSADYEESLKKGRESLGGYYDNYKGSWNKNLITEYGINNVYLGEGENKVLLKGKLDKVELIDSKKVNVVDYKTGKVKSEAGIRGETKADEGGNYFRQLVFYKILLELDDSKKYEMESGEIDFIEPNDSGNYKKYKFGVTDDETAELKKIILDSAKEIIDFDFSDRNCSDLECEYCALSKYLIQSS
ncbi:MAG: ATP-dependent DNA helicase [bacterium]|nr:ATP-dependent DNA helicase [bacterium]